MRRKLGYFLKIKKIARWRHKSEIKKINQKTIISSLLILLWERFVRQKKQYDPIKFTLWVWVAVSSQNLINSVNIPQSSKNLLLLGIFSEFIQSWLETAAQTHKVNLTGSYCFF